MSPHYKIDFPHLTGLYKLNVKVKKIKETDTHYYGLIISGSFFQQNELIVNNATGELSISYKLKGKRAPWLICKSATPIEGLYSGRIVTNNKHAVDVGCFTFKFKDQYQKSNLASDIEVRFRI